VLTLQEGFLNTTQRQKSSHRYLQVRDAIEADIRSGKYQVGELLPKEEVLAATYDVSRHTIREAMRGLVDAGMVERFPRRGSFVKSTEPVVESRKFVAGVSNVNDVLQYTAQTRLTILMRSRTQIPPAIAKELNSDGLSHDWIRFVCCRWLPDNTLIGFSNLYVLPEHESIGEAVEQGGGSVRVFGLLGSQFHVPVRRVWQKIEASLMPEEAPFALRNNHGRPALRLLRAYYGDDDRMLTFSDNYFLSDRFQLISQWEHDPE